MIGTFRTIAVGAAVSLAAATQAQALNARTWISGAGIDQTGCGPIANPCRTLQYAHDNTSADGEIDVKDSAGYGAVSITKAISIIADGPLGGVLAPPNGNGITISVGASDLVILRGLTIEGGSAGQQGIEMSSAGILNVARCSVQRFNLGIYVHPPCCSAPIDVTIQDTDVSYNSGTGIAISGGAIAGQTTILNSVVNHNGNYGIAAYASTTISNTHVSNNTNRGISTYFGTSVLDNVTSIGNGTGIFVNSGTFLLGRSTIVRNTKGIDLQYAGTALSYKNNQISGNGTDIANGTLQAAPLQ